MRVGQRAVRAFTGGALSGSVCGTRRGKGVDRGKGTVGTRLPVLCALRRWEQPLRLALEPPPLVSELVDLGLQLLEVQGEWQVREGRAGEGTGRDGTGRDGTGRDGTGRDGTGGEGGRAVHEECREREPRCDCCAQASHLATHCHHGGVSCPPAASTSQQPHLPCPAHLLPCRPPPRQPEDGSPEELGALVTELLQQNRPELEREIGLVVDEQGAWPRVRDRVSHG